jgi:hypothetical protein
MLKFLLILVPVLAVMTANDDNMLTILGASPNPALAAGIAAFIALLVFHYRPVFLAAVVVLAVAANLPAETAVSLGVERTYALAALISAIISPRIISQLD